MTIAKVTFSINVSPPEQFNAINFENISEIGVYDICQKFEWLLYTTRTLMSSKQKGCKTSRVLYRIEFSVPELPRSNHPDLPGQCPAEKEKVTYNIDI